MAYRDQAGRLDRAGTNKIGKEHFNSLYGPAREIAITKKNILARWAKSGLYPFNPNKVLKDVVKPPTALTIPKHSEVDVALRPHGVVVQTQ